MKENELLSIKTFSEYTGVKQHILRHYDEIGIFQPVVRGENNYRYYSPQQITALNMVNVLSDTRVLLREIGELQHERSPEIVLDVLQKHERGIDAELRKLHDAYAIIHMYQHLILEGMLANEKELTLRDMEEFPIFLGPENTFSDEGLFYPDFIEFSKYAREHGINMSYPVGGWFENMDAFIKSPSSPTRFFSTSPRGTERKPAGKYLVGYTRGYYGPMGDLPEKFRVYAAENRLQFVGPVFVIYVLDEVSEKDPDNYLAQVAVQVMKKRLR